jgi:hypothetical protein
MSLTSGWFKRYANKCLTTTARILEPFFFAQQNMLTKSPPTTSKWHLHYASLDGGVGSAPPPLEEVGKASVPTAALRTLAGMRFCPGVPLQPLLGR